jgi:hypothetical protein
MQTSARRKLQGEWAEVCFAARALKLGLVISKPLGDCAAYDFIVDSGRKLLRIQVRSVSRESQKGVYKVSAARGARKHRLTSRHIDFIAAYVIPWDAWYIIPVAALRRRTCLHLVPHRASKRRYESFRARWSLFRC